MGENVAKIGAAVAAAIFLICCVGGVVLAAVGADGAKDGAGRPVVTPTTYGPPGPTGGPVR